MDEPTVSVVMAAYNERPYILETVNSILGQTLAKLELIIVDDGSTDGTYELLKTVDDPRLRLIRNERNLGLTASLNVGRALARAPYVARLDAHDLCHPERLERQVAYFEAHPDLGLLGSSILRVDHRGRLVDTVRLKTRSDGIREKLLKENQFFHSAIMARREALQQVGGYREAFRYAQDYDLWLRLSEHWPVDNLVEPLITRRLASGGITWSQKEAQAAYADLARRLAWERREHGRELTSAEDASREILANIVPDPIARARSLLIYAETLISRGYSLEALPYLARSVLAAPFWSEHWRLLARMTGEKLGLCRRGR